MAITDFHQQTAQPFIWLLLLTLGRWASQESAWL